MRGGITEITFQLLSQQGRFVLWVVHYGRGRGRPQLLLLYPAAVALLASQQSLLTLPLVQVVARLCKVHMYAARVLLVRAGPNAHPVPLGKNTELQSNTTIRYASEPCIMGDIIYNTPQYNTTILHDTLNMISYFYSCSVLGRKKLSVEWAPTGQVQGLVHHELLCKANVAEILLALAHGDDLAALIENLAYDLLAGILGEPPDKHGLASWGALPGGRRGEIWGNKAIWRECMVKRSRNMNE